LDFNKCDFHFAERQIFSHYSIGGKDEELAPELVQGTATSPHRLAKRRKVIQAVAIDLTNHKHDYISSLLS
jgi:hypothetical protein